jgi:RIO-like serine/threonine protein kinase
VDDLLSRQRPGARARGLKPQKDGRDGLILDESQLVSAHRLAQHAPHLFERDVQHLVELFGRRAGVNLEDARVYEVAADRADRVGEAPLLAHALPEA